MIVVGYSADPFGRAALEHGIAEAKLRNTGLRVINSSSGEAYVDAGFAQSGEVHDVEQHLNECGVEFELTQPVGVDTAEELRAENASHCMTCAKPAPSLGIQRADES